MRSEKLGPVVDAGGHILEPADTWSLTVKIIEHLGEDYFIWASDYPHINASFGVVQTIREHLAGLPPTTQRKVLGENAMKFYNL